MWRCAAVWMVVGGCGGAPPPLHPADPQVGETQLACTNLSAAERNATVQRMSDAARARDRHLAAANLVAVVAEPLPAELETSYGPTPYEPPRVGTSREAVRGKQLGDVVEYDHAGTHHRGIWVDADVWLLVQRGGDVYIVVPSTRTPLACTIPNAAACGSPPLGTIVRIPAGTTPRGTLPLEWEHVELAIQGDPPGACPA